jgi:hypothetical protein
VRFVRGTCQLFVDGAPVSAVQTNGERQQASVAPNHPFSAPGTMALTGISDAVGAGAHTATVGCTEVDGDLAWLPISLVAARASTTTGSRAVQDPPMPPRTPGRAR